MIDEEVLEESDDETVNSDYIYEDEFYILYYVKALYDFESDNPNDLSFPKSSIIAVYQEKDEWLSGNHNGHVGWFPKNYVQVIKNDDEEEEEEPSSSNGPSLYKSSYYEPLSSNKISTLGQLNNSKKFGSRQTLSDGTLV